MSLSVAVMMHPSRERYREYLVERLGDVAIVMDEGGGLWDTCRRAWLARPSDSDFHLVLQDDAILCDGFMDRAAEWLDHDSATSFYFGRRDSYSEAVRAGLEAGSVTLPRLHWGLAVCLPTHLIEPMLAYGGSLDIAQDDARIDRFLRSRGIPVRYPMPSLVDHRIGDSLVGDPGCNRKAFHFIDAPDVVYVCRKGENEELRYSLRSLQKHLRCLRKVWIFGDRPAFLTDDESLIEHVPHSAVARIGDFPTPVTNLFRQIFLSSLIPELDAEYLFFSDDFILIADLPRESARKTRYLEDLAQIDNRGRDLWKDRHCRTNDELSR